MKTPALFLVFCACAAAETRILTLKQALDLALEQNPDLVIARLDEQRARDQVIIARDPFSPKVFAGSGLAWTYGFPTSIEGQAPSIMEARTNMSLFDRPQAYLIAQARENLKGSAFDLAAKQEEVAFRVASLFLDARTAALSLTAAQREAEDLTRVQQLVDARVQDGRELPIESTRARVAVLRTKQRAEALGLDALTAESSLAQVLGMGINDRVQADQEEPIRLVAPDSEDATIAQALESSPELKRLQSNLQAKQFEVKSYKAQRLPKVDLVAQYSLLGKYNNYQQFFSHFQRNNIELGASFSIPVLAGRASGAYASQAEADAAKIRAEIERTRARIAGDLRRAFQDVRRADAARDLARADLDLARDQIAIDLAQMEEGRVAPAKTEQDRATENEKWLALYDAQTTAERARLSLLQHTGTLLAALR
ncbi:MAG: TolC family protein [Bryobacterales bacterium]|nr:TolC family protein [Bryobacterales bacterium]MBV9401713.1 TolC family protein [Bryobacterales bacterium]